MRTNPIQVTGLIGLLLTVSFGGAVAQTQDTGIALPYNPDTDSASTIPSGSAQTDSPRPVDRAIVGEDEREPVLTRLFPWSAMGRLEWQIEGEAVSTCTATLISKDAILTNSHCLIIPQPDETGEFVDTFIEPEAYARVIEEYSEFELKLVFKPSLIDGIALDEAEIVTYEAGWTRDYEAPKDDWAVLKLDQPLGEAYGVLGWRNLDFSNPDVLDEAFENINLLGYAGDFPTASLEEFGEPTETAGVDLACSILGLWPEGSLLEDTLVHDCDTNPGASGGPIFAKFTDGQYYLVGLHARSTPLNETITLPNGVETDIVNGGVTVSRWQAAAARATQ